jgi:hypothetical protein
MAYAGRVLAHIGGVPVEESLLYVAPVIAVVGWMYYAGWRERRPHRRDREAGELDAPWTPDGPDAPGEDPHARPVRRPDASVR